MKSFSKIKQKYSDLSFPKKLSLSMILITCLIAVYLTIFAFFSAAYLFQQFSTELADSYASNICRQLENYFSDVTQTATNIIQMCIRDRPEDCRCVRGCAWYCHQLSVPVHADHRHGTHQRFCVRMKRVFENLL